MATEEKVTTIPQPKVKDLMTWDHMRLDYLYGQFLSALEKRERATPVIFLQFKEALKQHILREEDILFPLYETRIAFEPQGEVDARELTSAVRAEHREIQQFLERIYDRLVKTGYAGDQLISQLFTALKSHEEKEEHVLYPWIDENINKGEREEAVTKITHELIKT